MKSRVLISSLSTFLFLAPVCARALDTLHDTCIVSASEHGSDFRLRLENKACNGDDHCGQFSNDLAGGISGLTLGDLAREGAQLTATIEGEAGKFSCAGTVRGGELRGESTFIPSEEFVRRMGQLGFDRLSSEKLQVYTIFDIRTDWVRSIGAGGIAGLTSDNLIALHIFHIDAAYAHDFSSLGYKTPDANKLIALKIQGVNAQEVREIRNLGFEPTLDELIQIRIFHITPEFIRAMQSRGFHNLTISKLTQMKIFKVDE